MKRSGESRRSNVATSPRRDVPTSRRPHVVTSPRRDVPTSRRWVNQYNSKQAVTSRRCEVCPPSLKALRVQNSRGDREAYERGHGIPEQQ